jgi:tetratricopeptide (TPR) repeat protein
MLDPNSAEAHYTLGIVRSKQRRTQDALRELKAAASLEPGNVKALLALADVYRQLSDYDGALDALSKAARLDDSADVHLRTAEVLYLGQKNAEARVEVEEVLKRDPGQVRAHILLARVYQAENREDKALEIARTLYRTSGSNTEATTFLRELLVVRARRQEAEGDVQAAVNTYSEAKSVAPTVAIYAALMSLENSRARYQATKQLFEEATAGNYLDVFVYNNAAVAYRRSGENERALSLYDAGIALEPRRSFLYNNKGYALATLSRFDEAVAEYDRAIKVDAKNIIAYVNKVQALVRLERYDKAQQVLDSAKRLEPENRSVALTQGFVYLTQRRWSEALATYDARLVRQPDDAVAQSGRGRALLELGRYGDAIAASDVALSKDGKLASAFSIRGFGKAQTGRIDEGIGDIREALKLEPNNPLAYYDLARIHTKRGETGEALKNLKNAIHIDPLFRSLARASPAFATLQGDDAFRSLVAKPD